MDLAKRKFLASLSSSHKILKMYNQVEDESIFMKVTMEVSHLAEDLALIIKNNFKDVELIQFQNGVTIVFFLKLNP